MSNGVKEWSDRGVIASAPRVTVLMLAFNHEAYLPEAIEAVVRQKTAFPIELLVGDDASTDKTLDVALEYQKRYPKIIRVVQGMENVGFQENFRRLVAMARGDLIAFCEGDDYWIDDEKLSTQVPLMDQDTRVSLVHGDIVLRVDYWGRKIVLNPRGVLKDVPDKRVLEGDLSERCFGDLVTHTSAIVCRTQHLVDYLNSDWAKHRGFAYDKSIVSYLALQGRAVYVDRPFSAYRISLNSLTRSGPQRDLAIAQELRYFFSHFRAETGKYRDTGDGIYLRYTMVIAKSAFHSRDGIAFSRALEELESSKAKVYGRQSAVLVFYKYAFYRPVVWIVAKSLLTGIENIKKAIQKTVVFVGLKERILLN